MGIKFLQKIEAETVTEMPARIPFEFTVRDSIPAGKDPGDCIVISPLKVRTWFRIRPLLLSIDKEDLDKLIHKEGEISEDLPEVMSKHDGMIMEIVCLGIHNKPSEPPAWFRDVLMDNSTWEDIHILLNAILYRIGYFPFCKSITTLANVSPWTETEIIAAQKNQESWYTLAKPDTSST